MITLPDKVTRFFNNQHMTIVSTIDKKGLPHNACKGIVDITKDGHVYLLDLYKAMTFVNLKQNPHISITGVNEHKFTGYCLKGRAKIMKDGKLSQRLIKAWDKRIASRITKRLLKEIGGERGHRHHTEALLPTPKYLIEMEVLEIIDLTPQHIKLQEA